MHDEPTQPIAIVGDAETGEVRAGTVTPGGIGAMRRPMTNLKQQNAMPTRKMLAYTASGATLGPALATLVAWAFEAIARQPLPDAVQTAILTLCIVGFGFLAGYQTPAGLSDVPVAKPDADDPAG